MGCCLMLGALDRAAIMAGVNVGLSQTRIAHLIGRSPSAVCREIARHTGPDGQYRAEEAGKGARAARRRPKKRLLDCDAVLRRRVIADLSQGYTSLQISAPLARRSVWHTALHGYFSRRSQRDQPRGDRHVDLRPPQEDTHRARYLLALAPVNAQETPSKRAQTPIVRMRLIDERPDISDRKILGNWEGDLIMGQDGASACATLVERTTRYLIIVALPLDRKADQVRRPHTPPPGPARRSSEHTDLGPRPGNGPPPAPHPRHRRGGVLRSPPQPLEERNQRKHQPTHPPQPAQRNPHHQPPTLPRRHHLRTGQLPQSHPRLPHPNRSIQPTHCYHPLTPPALGQIIVVDNIKYMPDITELQSRCNLIYFTKQEGHGRYGFHNDIHNEPSSIRRHPMSNSPTFRYKPMWKLLVDQDMTKT